MPDHVGGWIETPEGVRKLRVDELAKGLGVPKGRFRHPLRVQAPLVNDLVGIHLWEGISAGIDTLRLSVFPNRCALSPVRPSIGDESQTPQALQEHPFFSIGHYQFLSE
jgi:hypothetical protein